LNRPSADYSRKWYVLAAVSMGILLATIDGSIVNVALPTLVDTFGSNFAQVEWVVLAYLLTLSTLLLSVGRLADMKGKKRIYTAGFVVFTIGSVLCGLAPAINWLIGSRVLQAVGAAMILALGSAIVTEAFPPSERGRALGTTGTMVSLGIILGPTVGGLLIDAFSWRSIFFVNLPVAIVGIAMALRFVPSSRPKGGQRFDFLGAGTLFASMFSFLLALSLGQNLGFGDLRVLILFALFAIFLAAFVTVERRSSQPMVDLTLFHNKLLSVNLITGFISFVGTAGTIILMPFYLQGVLGYDPRQVGLLMAVVPVVAGILAPISGSLSDRFGTRPMTVAGLAMLMFGFFSLSTLGLHTTGLGYILRFLPFGLGIGLFQSPNNSAIMGSAARERLGIVSGLLALTRTLGQTTGIALMGAAWAGLTFAHAGGALPGGATAAPAAAQVAALHGVFLGLVVLLAGALALAVWAYAVERRPAAAGPPPDVAPRARPITEQAEIR